jgi:hypothetical protein
MVVLSEQRISMHDVARERGVHYRKVQNWVSIGVRGVVLESALSGGRRYTSREALARFDAAINAKSA